MIFDPKQIDHYPIQPGVYLMKDGHGDVLYVGKAKNLRQRLRQYFSLGDERPMVPHLVAKVAAVEVIVVSSEKEALLLENNLIKSHQPPYNVCLKDDRSFLGLRLTTQEHWPRLELVRYRDMEANEGDCFGPYPSAATAREVLEALQKAFPLRQCSNEEFVRRTRPCLLHGMGRCLAPCVGLCTQEEYQSQVQKISRFLKGQDRQWLAQLKTERDEASLRLDFEKAGELHRTIGRLEAALERQRVDKVDGSNSDAWGLFRIADEVALTCLTTRGGKLADARNYSFSGIVSEDEEVFTAALQQHYSRGVPLPHEILLPMRWEDINALEEVLAAYGSRAVPLNCPQRGDKKALVDMAQANAEAFFRQQNDARTLREKSLLEIRELLHLDHYPSRIECFDNSHLSGSHPVSAMVSFVDGVKNTKGFRTYHLKETTQGGDDYASLREVLMRRYRRAKEDNNLPHLLVVDGGKAHLNHALKVLESLDVATVDVIGVAKEEGRHDKGISREKIFLPGHKEPLCLSPSSPALFLLQQIRDEAHRFVLAFGRKSRDKATLQSELRAIPGIGPKKAKLLLKHFGSVKKIKEATVDQLSHVKGLSEKDRHTIADLFQLNT